MEDAEDVDCDPELGTRRLPATDAFPLSVNFDSKCVSRRHGDRAKLGNLLHRENRTGKTRILCRRRRTGRLVLFQSKVTLN